MTDLDIGMNDWLCEPLRWDDQRRYDRGKVMTFEDLEAGKAFGRYLDVDGDGIPYRTLPGAHPTRGAYFTRGTSRDPYARYSEEGAVYVDNMQRLLRKLGPRSGWCRPGPAPGGAAGASRRALLRLDRGSDGGDPRRPRGGRPAPRCHAPARLSFADEVADFVQAHEQVFVVEQNRDAQMRTLVNEGGLDPARLVPILHHDGTPITARFIGTAIAERLAALNIVPFRKAVSRPTWPSPSSTTRPCRPTRWATRIATTRARSARCAPAAATIDQRRDHPGLLRARPRAAPARQALRHRLLVEDATYFLGQSHGFNSVHGRMPSVLTANLPIAS